MDDLLVPKVPAIRVQEPNAPTRQRTRTSLGPDVGASASAPTRGPVSRVINGAANLLLSLRDGLTESERAHARNVEERMQILALRMKNAETVAQWLAAARELDTLEGNDNWKSDPTTGDYNPVLIEARLRELDEARIYCDIPAMMHLVRTALSRDLGGMGNADLYRHCYVGTKTLIDRYVDSAIQTIDALVDKSRHALPEGMGHKDLLEGMLYARQAFGRSALLLSGGATFGMNHIGVLKSLFEARLLPRIISGASAGSIVCSVVCTRTDEEIPALLETFPYGDLAVFDAPDSTATAWEKLSRLLTGQGWANIDNLTRVMRDLLGDITFQEGYNRTRRILNICVSTASIYDLPRLLNYVTAPNVMIWSAVAASCSVPGVYKASPLLVKNPSTGEYEPWNPTPQHWIDGSVDNDLPMTRLAELFNVNHFIVSQVNPHVVPFLSRDDELIPPTDGKRHDSKSGSGPPSHASDTNGANSDWLAGLTTFAMGEVLHRMHFFAEVGVLPNFMTKLQSILSQKYSGDITILPEISVQDLPRILSNPTSDFMLRACLRGERATWPKLSRIHDRCAIELALDRAVHRLRTRVVFSDSQVDLRRWVTNGHTFHLLRQGEDIGGDLGVQHSHEIGYEDRDGQRRRHHKRRSSGASLQLIAQQRRMQHGGGLTDEDTDREEQVEMMSRQGQIMARKPRLKRASQSHPNVLPYHHIGPLTAARSPIPDFREFDFSKPPTPPMRATLGDDSVPPNDGGASRADIDQKLLFAQEIQEVDSTYLKSPLMRGTKARARILSPTDEMITSDVHSSDGDLESQTNYSVSDPDPYDGDWLEVSPERGRGSKRDDIEIDLDSPLRGRSSIQRDEATQASTRESSLTALAKQATQPSRESSLTTLARRATQPTQPTEQSQPDAGGREGLWD